jgi:NAD-dependent SIR2 family protein deacetylase
MESSSLKKIIIVVVCIAAALIVFGLSRTSNSDISDLKGEKIDVKCKACGAEYQMDMMEFYNFRREHADPKTQKVLLPPCQKCGKNAIDERTQQ